MSNAVLLGQAVLKPTRQFKFVRTVCTAPKHASTRALIDCWRTYEKDGGMRMCRDIPSRAIGKLLQYILIAEPINDWNDANIRLAGTALIERFGRDIAGMTLCENYADDREGASILLQLGAETTRLREPRLLDTRIFIEGIEMLHLETVMLPIFAPDGVSTWVMAGAFRF